jgi:hypothetical protein
VFNNSTKSPALKRVTNTPGIDEMFPGDYDNDHVSYLSDLNGIRNRYIARFDSALAYVDTSAHYRTIVTSSPVTNYSRSILEQQVNVQANKITEVLFIDGKFKMYVTPLVPVSELKIPTLQNTSYRDYKNRIEKKEQVEEDAKNRVLNETPQAEDVKVIENPAPAKKDSSEVDINNYSFENEPKKTNPPATAKPPVTSPAPASADTTVRRMEEAFVLGRQRNYNMNYSVDYVVSQLDNSFLNASYQKFTGGGSPIYLNPGINAFFKIGMSDLFEDYRIVGGMRIPFEIFTNLSNFNMIGGEYLLSFENRMKMIDKQIVLHRESHISLGEGNSLVKVFTNDIRYILKYPFSEVAGVRGTVTYRNDKTVFTAIDSNDLKRPDDFENWISGKLEYVYDNSLKRGLNLYNGFRGKIFGEYYRQLDKAETDFFVLGLDARYYKKLHRDLIWANRIAASTSFGKQKLIYYMGGVDNWFAPKFDNTTNIATDQNYAYQTLATNMRGFYQNVRNGNSFVVINSEIRFPIFKYLYKRPIRSDFVQNFQIITFGDIGTAWTGPSPYSDENSLNTTIIAVPGNPLEITLNTQHDPIVGGYGFGVRSRLFGYFVRLDRAWGVQDGIVLKPIWHLSFSLDF